MKIGILTLPLTANYGAYLQNYALQKVLKRLNHFPLTIDYSSPAPSFFRILLSCAKSIVFFPRSLKRKKFFSILLPQKRLVPFTKFMKSFISSTSKYKNLKTNIIAENGLDVVIVGSDQVWRPKYNSDVKNMFLDFCANEVNLKRIAYAASFGVDDWEYSFEETQMCSTLAKKFNSISVREKSGVDICKKYLCVNSTWVLDPTLLLGKDDYCEICKDIPKPKEKILIAYVLDDSQSIKSECEFIAKEKGLTIKYFRSGDKARLTVPEWLAMFRDASYVVTDSFHGTVFSIIFEKDFKCIYNKSRGSARFDSLLQMYNLGKLDEMRQFSINWLKNALET